MRSTTKKKQIWFIESPTANQIEKFACRFERPNPFANNNKKSTSYIFDDYNYNRCMFERCWFLMRCSFRSIGAFFALKLCFDVLPLFWCARVCLHACECVWRVALFLANRVGFCVRSVDQSHSFIVLIRWLFCCLLLFSYVCVFFFHLSFFAKGVETVDFFFFFCICLNSSLFDQTGERLVWIWSHFGGARGRKFTSDCTVVD